MSASTEMSAAMQSQLPVVPPMPSVPESVASRRLAKDPADMVTRIVSHIDATALRLVSCQTKGEFFELRKEVFRRYAQFSVALANIVTAEEVDRATLEALTIDTLAEFERTLRENGSRVVADAALEEILFSLSTLRRTYKLRSRISLTSAPNQSEPEDRETAGEYNWWMLFSQMHLDCLLMAIRRGLTLADEVLPEIIAGFRCVVMAYSCARQGVRLREFPRFHDFSGVIWTEEDQRLAEGSTLEREAALQGW